MKKTCRVARYVLSFLFIACFTGIGEAAPYGPDGRVINWVQPSGEKLRLRVFGDDYYARTQTEQGFTVVYNPADGAYHYAELNEKGSTLKPSGIKAHLPRPGGLSKAIDLPKDSIRAIYRQNLTRFAGERNQLWSQRVQAVNALKTTPAGGARLNGPAMEAAQIKAAPVVGNKIGLTILVQFPNDAQTDTRDPIDFPVSRAQIVDFCNKEGYKANGNSGSVRDYFYDQSGGKVTYTQKVTQIVTLTRARNFYNYDDYPTNNVLRDTGEAGRMLIADAVEILKSSGFDFSGLTTDAERNAIATNMFFAGPDSGVWANGLWPHQWNLAQGLNVGTDANPIYLYKYQVTNIENSAPVIGTFCHENGHLLIDYPDLYDIFGEGVGEHCLMGSGNYLNDGKTPSPINAHFKDLVGWANITELTTADFITKSLPTTGNVAYRIRKASLSTESFVIENRGKGDKWADYSNDKGIAIWHIDETVDGNIGESPYMVSLEQADGSFDLEGGLNRGDGTDLFDLTFPLFTDTTAPNANWWDGSSSGIRVKVLSDVNSKTSVQFGKLPPDTIIVDSPNGGEVMYRDSTFVIRWEANIVGDVQIELFKGAVLQNTIATNVPNIGTYNWEIPANFPGADNYRIRIRSITNPKPTFDFSDDEFTITDLTFPIGNRMPYGWAKPKDAATSWIVTDSSVFEGTHALKSKNPGDGQMSAISYTSNFKPGMLSFYIKVSSEEGYDFASFYIDGVRQRLPGATGKRGLTGRQSWSFASFDLSGGKHTLTWTYEKDDSYGEGKDGAWLDGVLLPPTKQKMVVQNAAGTRLTSGQGETVFDTTRKGFVSEPKTFTIRNTGKADLHGLALEIKGSGASHFNLGSLGKSALKPGESTTFTVSFAPKSIGVESASVQILSFGTTKKTFVIPVRGKAIGVPSIAVFQPEGNKLKNGKGTISFGTANVKQTGSTRVFTVMNNGTDFVTGLKVTGSGEAKGDFDIRAIGSRTLAPGESTTFKVTFTPQQADERDARIRIKYDYKVAGSFDVRVTGKGASKKGAKSTLGRPSGLFDAVFGPASNGGAAITSTEVIGGLKYLSLTVAKPSIADGVTPTVEVSSNLVDWFSGPKHTTIVIDNADFQKVRDNTPVTPGEKRYIRLKD